MSDPALADLLRTLRSALGRDARSPPPDVPAVPDDVRPIVGADLVAAFIENARRAGAEILHGAPEPADATPDPWDAAVTVARARVAIAASGTVVIDEGSPLAVMTPSTLVVSVDPAVIVATLRDAFAALGRHPLPSTRLFVTGPSKTADIEGVLITGVHGPKRLVIALAPDAS